MHPSALLICLFAWPSLSVASPRSENRRVLSSSVPYNMEEYENEDQLLALSADRSGQPLFLGAQSQSSNYLRPPSPQRFENDQLSQLLNQILSHNPLEQPLESQQILNGIPEHVLPLLHQDYHNTLEKHSESHQILNGMPEHLLPSLSQNQQHNVNPVNVAANSTIPWTAPPFHSSLKSFKESIAEITKHFTENGFTDKDDKNFRYIVIIGAVKGLSLHIAQHGWQNYNSSYHSLILHQIDNAVLDPRGVAEEFLCHIKHIYMRIDKIVALMNHSAIQLICSAMPSACDASIFAAIRVLNDEILTKQAEALLYIGWAAESFQTHYASAFEALSTQNVYAYLYNEGLTALREQLTNNVRVIVQLLPDSENVCEVKREKKQFSNHMSFV